jgi:large subunit ribosomal protein L13
MDLYSIIFPLFAETLNFYLQKWGKTCMMIPSLFRECKDIYTMTKKQRMRRTETFLPNANKISRNWLILDATGKTLGRFASEVAKILRGKHKPLHCPSVDCGDGVIVINADKIKVTGNKEASKIYRYHTGFVGNLREIPYRTMQARKPEFIIEHAVKGMVPRTTQGREQMKRLRIFAGETHNLEAQKPIQVNI